MLLRGPADVEMRVIEGVAVLQGFMLTHREPRPVTMDVFGLPSATVRGWAQEDELHASGDTVELEPYSSWLLRAATPGE